LGTVTDDGDDGLEGYDKWTDQLGEWEIKTKLDVEPWRGSEVYLGNDEWLIIERDDDDGSLRILGVDSTARSGDGWTIGARWELLGDRAEPTRLALEPPEGQPIIAEEVRRRPIGTVLGLMRGCVAAHVSEFIELMWSAPPEGYERYAADVGPHRGKPLADAELAAVAAVYRQARKHGYNVREAVQTEFGLTASGAAKRIRRARDAGLLDGGRKR
jgi:hypothetical protein